LENKDNLPENIIMKKIRDQDSSLTVIPWILWEKENKNQENQENQVNNENNENPENKEEKENEDWSCFGYNIIEKEKEQSQLSLSLLRNWPLIVWSGGLIMAFLITFNHK